MYQGVTYTYRKNMFGDIVAIYQGSTKVAEYAYDEWGNYTNDITAKAYSLTFGNNKGFYYGYDDYWYWGSISFD